MILEQDEIEARVADSLGIDPSGVSLDFDPGEYRRIRIFATVMRRGDRPIRERIAAEVDALRDQANAAAASGDDRIADLCETIADRLADLFT